MVRKLLIDGDGCPVVELAIKASKKFNIHPILIFDTAHQYYIEGVETVVVSKGSDAVDFVLVNKVRKGDIVVTQDYGLAAMVLSKGGYAINQNGILYTDENMDNLLFQRYVSKKIRNSGGKLKGPKKRKAMDNENFYIELTKLCKHVIEGTESNE